MKQEIILLFLILLVSKSLQAQKIYEVQPGLKGNQIILEISNISATEVVEIKSLSKLSKRGAYERVSFTSEKEKSIELQPGETKELVFNFDVAYNIGNVEADTVEFMITDNKLINITKQFILRYTIPTEYKLEQNYPNPFNPTTKIRYTIPDVGSELAQTVIKVYDILGNEVTTLVNEQKEPGYYEVEFNAERLSSGVYFYRLQAGNFTQTIKMILMR